ncbi:AAA family ATPase [candidate division KSB1 bacterium]
MSVITISRGTFSGSKELAEQLSKKLDYRCISREFLTEKATQYGIPVDKLRNSVLKPPRARQPLGHLRDLYLAYMRYSLCEEILSDNIVYHGNTGHLLLTGIPNILRIRVMADLEFRIRAVEQRLHMEREVTKKHIETIDSERDKWIRFLYGINWSDPIHYDFIVNLTETPVNSAVGALSAMAGTAGFTFTTAAVKAIENLRLANYAHVLLGMDKRTQSADVKITAADGYLNVTYTPQQAHYSPFVNEILSTMDGCKEVNATIASTNILWIQEKYEQNSETYHNILELAKKWDAAVEMMRWDATAEASVSSDTDGANSELLSFDPHTSEVREALKNEGHAGGCVTVYGDFEHLCESIPHPKEYSLIVADGLFLSRPHAAQRRLTNEIRSALADTFETPVVGPEELKQKAHFSLRNKVKLVAQFVGALILFLAVFLNQEAALTFLAGEAYREWRILAIASVVIFVPVFAYMYASTIKTVLKMFKID